MKIRWLMLVILALVWGCKGLPAHTDQKLERALNLADRKEDKEPQVRPEPQALAIHPTLVPATAACQSWSCQQPFGAIEVGKCCDENQDGQFDETECSGLTPTLGLQFPAACPVVPTPTPRPSLTGGCKTFFCGSAAARSEAGQCCDKNENGTYEPGECTGKTPHNGFEDESSRCRL